jgi:hypothetical protein
MICAETLSLRLARHDHERESIPASGVSVGPSRVSRRQELAPRPFSSGDSRSWGRTRLGDDEDLVAESLCHQPDRDPFEGVPDEVFNIRFREIECHKRNFTTASAQLNNLSVQRDPCSTRSKA